MILFPDLFEQPHEYWLMIKNCMVTPEYKKRQQLKTVGLDYDKEPMGRKAV